MGQQYNTYGYYDTEQEYGQEYLGQTGRMYVRANVFLPGSDIDPTTGYLKPDHPRRGRIQAKSLEYAYLEKEYQKVDAALKARMEKPSLRISLKTAVIMILVFGIFFGFALLSQNGTLAEKQKTLFRLNRSIEECSSINQSLAQQIADASDATKICYSAARDLQMIPAEAAEAIHLVAMDTRPLETQAAQPAGQDLWPTQEGTDHGAVVAQQQEEPPSTMIPSIASADGGP